MHGAAAVVDRYQIGVYLIMKDHSLSLETAIILIFSKAGSDETGRMDLAPQV